MYLERRENKRVSLDDSVTRGAGRVEIVTHDITGTGFGVV